LPNFRSHLKLSTRFLLSGDIEGLCFSRPA
jgi:hypothetical protein